MLWTLFTHSGAMFFGIFCGLFLNKQARTHYAEEFQKGMEEGRLENPK